MGFDPYASHNADDNARDIDTLRSEVERLKKDVKHLTHEFIETQLDLLEMCALAENLAAALFRKAGE